MKSVEDFKKKYSLITEDLIFTEERRKYVEKGQRNELLLEGEHTKVFYKDLSEKFQKDYKIVNMIFNGIHIKENLMNQSRFKIKKSQKNKDDLERMIKKQKIKNMIATQGKFLKTYGNAFYYFDIDVDEYEDEYLDPKLRVAHPSTVGYIRSEGSYKYDYDYLYVFNKDTNDDGLEFIELNLHSKVDFATLMYYKDSDGFYRLNDSESSKPFTHDYGDFLLFNVKNKPTINFYSDADINNVVYQAQYEVNILATLAYHINYNHAFPLIFSDAGTMNSLAMMLSKRGLTQGQIQQIDDLRAKYINGGSKEQFFVQSVFPTIKPEEFGKILEEKKDEVLNALSVDTGLYRKETATYASGKALQIDKYKTINDVQATVNQHIEVLEEIFTVYIFLLHKLSIVGDIDPNEEIELEWRVSLYKDEEVELDLESKRIDNEQKKKDLGVIVSDEARTKKLEKMTDEEIAAEKLKIQQEEMEDLPQVNRGVSSTGDNLEI